MNSKDLEVFIHLATSLHFGKAAQSAHLSASAVSRSVQRLEEQLGSQLLERDNRRVVLTPAGQEFLTYAEQTVQGWQAVRQRLQADKTLRGAISLFCSVTASYSVLNTILEVFRQRYPAIELKLHTGDQADALDRIAKGGEEIGITGRPESLPERLAFQSLTGSPLRLVAPNIPCALNDRIGAADGVLDLPLLNELPFILPERGVARELIERWFSQQSLRPTVYAQVSGHEAIVSTVGLGFGVGIVPELVLETSFLRERVRTVSVSPPLPAMDIGIVALARRLQNPLVRAFWDCALSSYRADK